MASPAFIASSSHCGEADVVPALSRVFCTRTLGRGTLTSLHGRDKCQEMFSSLNDDNNFVRRPMSLDGGTTRKKKSASACLSLILSVLLLGNFDMSINDIHCLQSNAFAIESVTLTSQTVGSNEQTPPWPPTSDQALFKQPPNNNRISSTSRPKRYWDIMQYGNAEEITTANEKLIDNAIATINTMYYDSSGGFVFDPKEFYSSWKNFRYLARHGGNDKQQYPIDYENAFGTRENTVRTMKWFVSLINDPYSKYLTREELTQELIGGDDGFLGLGALVDVPSAADNELMQLSIPGRQPDWNSILTLDKVSSRNRNGQWQGVSMDEVMAAIAKRKIVVAKQLKSKNKDVLSVNQASNLPVIKAIVPDSPAERAGLVVGDRIASVGTYQFTGMSRPQVRKALDDKFHAQNYFGRADLTIAKPIAAPQSWETDEDTQDKYVFEEGWYQPKKIQPRSYQRRPEQVIAFKLSHVKNIPTTLTANSPFRNLGPDETPTRSRSLKKSDFFPEVVGGDSIVHYATLTSNDSIFQNNGARPVGYIRLTRFSKASTAGYINAINSLEAAGVDAYIIDLRNNYGGVIQEAMLTASTLLRDPHSVLCYTLNGRGGFRPQENMEYIVDKR